MLFKLGVGSPLVKSPQNTLNEFRSPQQNTSNNSHQSPPTRMSTEQSPPMIAAPIPSLPAHQSHQIFHQYLPYQNSHQFASHSTLFPQEPVQRQMGTSWPYLQGSQCPPSIFSPESAFVQHSQSPTLMPKMTGTSSPPISFNYGERGPELEMLEIFICKKYSEVHSLFSFHSLFHFPLFILPTLYFYIHSGVHSHFFIT